MERVLICGDRNWTDYDTVVKELSKVHQEQGVEIVIEGDANGADRLGGLAATVLGIPFKSYPAQWHKFGKQAGPLRNIQMLKEGKPTLVLAFHDFLENSKGTGHMVKIAREANVPVLVFKSKGRESGKNVSH